MRAEPAAVKHPKGARHGGERVTGRRRVWRVPSRGGCGAGVRSSTRGVRFFGGGVRTAAVGWVVGCGTGGRAGASGAQPRHSPLPIGFPRARSRVATAGAATYTHARTATPSASRTTSRTTRS